MHTEAYPVQHDACADDRIFDVLADDALQAVLVVNRQMNTIQEAVRPRRAIRPFWLSNMASQRVESK